MRKDLVLCALTVDKYFAGFWPRRSKNFHENIYRVKIYIIPCSMNERLIYSFLVNYYCYHIGEAEKGISFGAIKISQSR